MQYDTKDNEIGFTCDACNNFHDFDGPFLTIPCTPYRVGDLELCDYCYEDYCNNMQAMHDARREDK